MPLTGSGKILKTELRLRFATRTAAPYQPPAPAQPGQAVLGLSTQLLAAAAAAALQIDVLPPSALVSSAACYVLPTTEGSALDEQLQWAFSRGARNLLLLAAVRPTAEVSRQLQQMVMAVQDADVALVVIDTAIAENAKLLAFALLDAKQEMPAVHGVLLPSVVEAPKLTAPAVSIAEMMEAAEPAAGTAARPVAAALPVSQGVAAMSAAGLGTAMADLVQAAISDVLGPTATAGIAADDPLMSAGVTSTLAITLTNRLEKALGVSLPATLVFDYPTIRDMSEYLAETLGGPGQPTAEAAAGPGAAAAPAAGPQLDVGAWASAAADLVSHEVRRLIGSSSDAVIDRSAPLMSVGVTSTLAVALATSLEAVVGAPLPATLVFDYPTIADIASFLAESTVLPFSLLQGAAAPAGTSAEVGAPPVRPGPAPSGPTTPEASPAAILIVASATRAPGPLAPDQYMHSGNAAAPLQTAALLHCTTSASPAGITSDATCVVPLCRWDCEFTLPEHLPGELQPRFGCFLPEVEQFDPAAVGMTAAEAVLVDPQQRLMMDLFAEAHAAAAASGLTSR
jgi:acyl carrier protein